MTTPWTKLLTLAFLSAALCLSGKEAQAEDSYQLGHGYNLGDFNFAGYANVVADLPSGAERRALVLDDLSLFVSGRVNRFVNPFFETELTSATILHSSGISQDKAAHMVLERIYDDVIVSDSLTFRAGKMLTPVGEWNQIHAAPLVPTNTRPLATERGFSEYTSGISLLYADADSNLPEIQAYWQPGREMLSRPRSTLLREYREIEGLHVSWPFELTDKVGISVQRSEIAGTGDTQYLAGVNGRYSWDRFGVEGELIGASIDRRHGLAQDSEWGGYVLGSYALTPEISAFTWYEHFQERNNTRSADDILAGMSYRPHPAIVWKAEYLANFGGVSYSASGFTASFSVLF